MSFLFHHSLAASYHLRILSLLKSSAHEQCNHMLLWTPVQVEPQGHHVLQETQKSYKKSCILARKDRAQQPHKDFILQKENLCVFLSTMIQNILHNFILMPQNTSGSSFLSYPVRKLLWPVSHLVYKVKGKMFKKHMDEGREQKPVFKKSIQNLTEHIQLFSYVEMVVESVLWKFTQLMVIYFLRCSVCNTCSIILRAKEPYGGGRPPQPCPGRELGPHWAFPFTAKSLWKSCSVSTSTAEAAWQSRRHWQWTFCWWHLLYMIRQHRTS